MNDMDIFFGQVSDKMALFDIIFIVVGIFIALVFIFVIAMFVSPKLRGKFMSRQIKAVKHMTDYSKKDIQDIGYNIGDATIKASKKIVDNNVEEMEDIFTKTASSSSKGVAILSKAIKDGIREKKEYCKYCGELIESDSIYCKQCGKKINLTNKQ